MYFKAPRQTPVERHLYNLWLKTSPTDAFASGYKRLCGKIWLPTKENKAWLRQELLKLRPKAMRAHDQAALAWIRSDLLALKDEEPNHFPASVSGIFFTHMLVEGFNSLHLEQLAEQSIRLEACYSHLAKKKWSMEQVILTDLECNAAQGVLKTCEKYVKSKRSKAAKAQLKALREVIEAWRKEFVDVDLKKRDFNEIYPLLKRSKRPLVRPDYRKKLRAYYDYPETAEKIESLALGWLRTELPLFRKAMRTLAKRCHVPAKREKVDQALCNRMPIHPKKVIKTISELRVSLQALAKEHWVDISKKYDVHLIETPEYLVPLLPTGAMQSFDIFTKKPHCYFYATTDKRGTPIDSIPEAVQLIIHEEYGHCVNYQNSATRFAARPRDLDLIHSSFNTPITEGMSFNRELESLDTFKHLAKGHPVVMAIKKYGPYDEFVESIEYVVRRWRVIRFLRAICDVRVNTGKQRYVDFIDWAAKKTQVAKKDIYNQTLLFLQQPGYAPGYSVFGQRIRALQPKIVKKGTSRIKFNTWLASRGFPPRRLLEKEIKQKFL